MFTYVKGLLSVGVKVLTIFGVVHFFLVLFLSIFLIFDFDRGSLQQRVDAADTVCKLMLLLLLLLRRRRRSGWR